MDDPPEQIEDIINGLTVRSSEEQHETILKYFAPDASFDHPLAWVLPSKNSREEVLNVFRAYKYLSNVQKIEVVSVGEYKLIKTIT